MLRTAGMASRTARKPPGENRVMCRAMMFDRLFRQAFTPEQKTASLLEEIHRQPLIDDAGLAEQHRFVTGCWPQQLADQFPRLLPARTDEFAPAILQCGTGIGPFAQATVKWTGLHEGLERRGQIFISIIRRAFHYFMVTSSSALVGCSATVSSRSFLVAPIRSATAKPCNISSAPGPMM